MSLELSIPGDWRSWDDASKDRLIARLKAETLLLGKVATYCEDETPSAMAKRWLGDRWHHRAYHDVLDQLALDLEAGVVDRATISMPPQVGKSTWVNWLVMWSLARHPLDPVIRMSYAAELATTHARFVQGYVEDYGAAYGLLQKRGDWAQHNWHTMTGAGLRSGGMLTGVAGFPAARMVIDDPIGGRALADSKIIREKTYNEYSANLLSRLRPGGWLLIVNTRWHDDDLNARVTKLEGVESKGGRWRVINLPAIILIGLCATLLIRGASESAKVNAIMVLIKIGVLVLFIAVGVTGWSSDNLSDFTLFCFIVICCASCMLLLY